MTYIFVFLGEFGYELLNWQGVIRKFSQSRLPGDRIVCCSRRGLDILYEYADDYIDISNDRLFRYSCAQMYDAVLPFRKTLHWKIRHYFHKMLCWRLRNFILSTLRHRLDLNDQDTPKVIENDFRFIFSSVSQQIGGLQFGIKDAPWLSIYSELNLENNRFNVLVPDLTVKTAIERKICLSLDEPFILVQGRVRDIPQKSNEKISNQSIIERISEHMPVVCIDFCTGRNKDSYSTFMLEKKRIFRYSCNSLRDQSCLIHHAYHCVFFTEGDFGSHIYLPPLFGRDVLTVAPDSVYSLPTAPIDFWNREVFRFGGQIIPLTYDEINTSPVMIFNAYE